MKALVYLGPAAKALEERPKPAIGVHGQKVALHLERLWDRNITITTRLVDTASTLTLLNILHSHKIDRILDAYETFAHAANTGALKVIIDA